MGVTHTRAAIAGFDPIVSPGARVLVLGSAPSAASLEKQQYYGKKQNSFWKIMGDLFAAGPEVSYQKRIVKLATAKVAVWDVIASCSRPGSLDSDIDMKSVEVNDFEAFFDAHADIRHVFFNGRKAEQTWRRFVLDDVGKQRPDIVYRTLPSTSPAMASLNYEAKLQAWRALAVALALELGQ